MSYLDVPRVHFAGEFFADPSTVNNSVANHNNAAPLANGWGPQGRHEFRLQNCTVRSVVTPAGATVDQAATDSLVGGAVTSSGVSAGVPRLVDLDPEHQTGSQIFGLQLHVQGAAGEGFTAVMETATLRELWSARAPGGFSAGFGGTFQSVLTPVTWTPSVGPLQSPVLGALRAAGPRLSIRLVTFRYDAAPASPTFCVGRIVGTIGPAAAAEPARFVAGRRLIHAGAGSFGVVALNGAAYNTAPFKIDAARRRLVVDLGNALREDSAGDRVAVGPLRAEIVNAGSAPATVLGSAPIPNTRASFLRNAGVEEIPLTPAQVSALATRPIRIKAGPDLVLAERPNGIHVDVSDTNVKLNPGETKDLELLVTQFGRPLAGAGVHIATSLGRGTPVTALSVRTGAPAFATALALPGVVTTGADGRVTIRLVAADPAHPRPDVDGQMSWLGFYIGASANPATQRGEIAVRVYDRHPLPAPGPPRLAHVRPIVEQYSRLYPAMRNVIDLNNHALVQSVAPALAASMRRAETAGNYMPVTRDLSRDKKALLLAWFDAGAPA